MVKTAEDYRAQAMRFVLLSGMNAGRVARECVGAYDAGVWAAVRHLSKNAAHRQEQTRREARAWAAQAAAWARIYRQAKGEPMGAREEAGETLAEAALNAANCAGYAAEISRRTALNELTRRERGVGAGAVAATVKNAPESEIDGKKGAMMQMPCADFTRLLDRVAQVTALTGKAPAQALLFIAGERDWVDIRRLARAMGWTHARSMDALKALLRNGLAERDGRKWRFHWRGVVWI